MSETPKSILPATGAACGSAGFSIVAAMGFCCYGPLAISLVGVTGAATLSRVEPFRPYLIGIAVLLLAWAFWRVYRSKIRPTGIQIVLWGSLIVLLVSAFFPNIAELFMTITPGKARG
jgi:hypothetical protein